MERIYGLKTDKENINLIVNGDKALIIIQAAEGFETRELKLQFDNEDVEVIPAVKLKSYGFSSDYDGGSESEVYEENGKVGVKVDPEVSHSLEDKLYYKEALEAIAKGAENPSELANEVLKVSELNFTRWYA